MAFITETFVGADDTELSALDADFEKLFGDASLLVDNNKLLISAAGLAHYYHSTVPPSSDYEVTIEFEQKGETSYTPSAIGRANPATSEYYYGLHDGVAWRIRRWTGSSNVSIASLTEGITVGTHTLTLRMEGSTLTLIADGVVKCSGTNTTLTAAGHAGLGEYYVIGTPSNTKGALISAFSASLIGDVSESITLSPDPASVVNGGTTQITITRSTAAPAGAGVTYNLTSGTPASATVPATVNMAEGQTTATFNVTGVSVGSSTITATNAADSNETYSITVNVVATRKLKLLAHVDALGATDVRGAVFAAPTGGALFGAKIGEFFGASFKATSESGKAPLEVDVADFGGEALTTADTPVCVWEGTSSAGSALGNAQPIGSSGVHECTVIEV